MRRKLSLYKFKKNNFLLKNSFFSSLMMCSFARCIKKNYIFYKFTPKPDSKHILRQPFKKYRNKNLVNYVQI